MTIPTPPQEVLASALWACPISCLFHIFPITGRGVTVSLTVSTGAGGAVFQGSLPVPHRPGEG